MSTDSEADITRTQRARIAELEDQLSSADRAGKAQGVAETSLRATLDYAESIVDTVREPMLVLDDTLRVRTASRAFYETFGVIEGRNRRRVYLRSRERPVEHSGPRTLLEEVLPRRK